MFFLLYHNHLFCYILLSSLIHVHIFCISILLAHRKTKGPCLKNILSSLALDTRQSIIWHINLNHMKAFLGIGLNNQSMIMLSFCLDKSTQWWLAWQNPDMMNCVKVWLWSSSPFKPLLILCVLPALAAQEHHQPPLLPSEDPQWQQQLQPHQPRCGVHECGFWGVLSAQIGVGSKGIRRAAPLCVSWCVWPSVMDTGKTCRRSGKRMLAPVKWWENVSSVNDDEMLDFRSISVCPCFKGCTNKTNLGGCLASHGLDIITMYVCTKNKMY